MKKFFSLILSILLFCSTLTFASCNENKSQLSSKNPVTLTMWHVYGEQADSPMNKLLQEFNETVGKNKGIIINVTNMSNATEIGKKLLDAQANKPGALEMPDLFTCHVNNAKDLGIENLLNWNDRFSKKELDAFVSDFITDGTAEGSLAVLPVSKSTQLLFVAGGVFDTFAQERSVNYNDLATWDGLFSVAEKYYEWSGGKPFCAIDYLTRCIELNAISNGATDFYTENGWYDTANETIMNSYTKFATAIAKGYIVLSDLYSNTQIMSGEVIAGIGSSASILYYNDKITYPNNVSIDMDLRVLTPPQAGSGTKIASQAGVGLCAYKTTERKAEACEVFAKWFTEEKRNLDFVASTGYMPVLNSSYDKINDYEFNSQPYKRLYSAIANTKATCTFLPETNLDGFWNKVYTLYANIRALQKNLSQKYASGATAESITSEMIEYFTAIN